MYNREKTREAEEVLQRISLELEKQGKTQAQLVDFLELPRGTYTNWKAGRSRSYCEHIGEIALYLQVSPEYLITGNVPPTAIENYAERELLLRYRSLSDSSQEKIMNIVREMTAKYSVD